MSATAAPMSGCQFLAITTFIFLNEWTKMRMKKEKHNHHQLCSHLIYDLIIRPYLMCQINNIGYKTIPTRPELPYPHTNNTTITINNIHLKANVIWDHQSHLGLTEVCVLYLVIVVAVVKHLLGHMLRLLSQEPSTMRWRLKEKICVKLLRWRFGMLIWVSSVIWDLLSIGFIVNSGIGILLLSFI